MGKVLASLLGLLAIPWIGSVTGLVLFYQLAICWQTLPARQFTAACCLVLPLLLLTTPVHEPGHVAAARWANLTVVVVSLFGVAVYRAAPSGPWRLGRTPRPYPGHCVVSLAQDGVDLRRRKRTSLLGGVAANLLAAALALGAGQVLFASGHDAVPFRPASAVALLWPDSLPVAALNLFVIANLCNVLQSLVLTEPGSPPSDGSQLLGLVREAHLERSIAHCYLQGWLACGVRPRDWEPGLVERLRDPGSPPSELPAAVFLYYHHEDRGEAAAAEDHLLRALELWGEPRPVWSGLAVEAAYVAGLHHRDAAAARAWLAQVKTEAVEPHTRERAEAAALLAEGHFGRAIVVAEQGLASSRASADHGGAEAERDWLRAIIDAGRQALDAPPGHSSTALARCGASTTPRQDLENQPRPAGEDTNESAPRGTERDRGHARRVSPRDELPGDSRFDPCTTGVDS